MNLIEQLQQTFIGFITSTFNASAQAITAINFNLNTDPQKAAFGDISTNAAMILAKELKQNPRAIAQTILDQFKSPIIEKLELAGPGFINIFVTKESFKTVTNQLLQEKELFFKDTSIEKKYNIEFVSANPTGPLHLGHGRGGIIGDVLGNVIRCLGYKATKEFYINDAGAQIEKLGMSFKIRCLQQLGQPAKLPEEAYHGEYLVELAQKCIATHGAEVLLKPDAFFALYAKEYLLGKIKETLSAYGIHFDLWFSEKTLHENGSIPLALETMQKNGYLFELDGALWFKSTSFGDDKDRVIKRASGEYTYVAADIAYVQNKLGRGYDQLVMVLGQDHHSYVQRLKGVMQALDHNPDKLDVILYQLVTLKESGESVRMSKRAGKIVSLKDITQTVGKDVARYFYLNRKADAHLDFDIDLALKKTDENPVYYIQYAYVRTCSILNKTIQEEVLKNITISDLGELDDSERLLIKKIIALKHTLQLIAQSYQTHMLSYYTHELAALFHSYYATHRVIDTDDIKTTRSRLVMIMLINQTLKTCLELLGIDTPEKM